MRVVESLGFVHNSSRIPQREMVTKNRRNARQTWSNSGYSTPYFGSVLTGWDPPGIENSSNRVPHRVPPGFLQGSTRVPPGFLQGSNRVPPGFLQGSQAPKSLAPPGPATQRTAGWLQPGSHSQFPAQTQHLSPRASGDGDLSGRNLLMLGCIRHSLLQMTGHHVAPFACFL